MKYELKYGKIPLCLKKASTKQKSLILKSATRKEATIPLISMGFLHIGCNSILRSTTRFFALTSTKMSSSPSSASANLLEVAQFSCLDDNYGYLIHCSATGQTAAIDTPCAKTYKKELEKRGWSLTHIFNTHHHWDHTGGNVDLKKLGDNIVVCGPKGEADKIPSIDTALGGGQEIEFGGTKAMILDVGGHTLGHIAYHFGSDGNSQLFCGDALFALGCGKMFEGTPKQFWGSMKRLRELPDETKVYCAHEYTLGNGKFAVSVEPNNAALQTRFEEVQKLRRIGKPTVPSTIGEEKETNPFLRADISKEIRENVNVVPSDSDEVAFGKVRRAKDKF